MILKYFVNLAYAPALLHHGSYDTVMNNLKIPVNVYDEKKDFMFIW